MFLIWHMLFLSQRDDILQIMPTSCKKNITNMSMTLLERALDGDDYYIFDRFWG